MLTPRFHHLKDRPVVYLSAEYAIEEGLPFYAGGLGVLAGDFLLEAGSQGLPVVAIGLFYRRGFETFNFASPKADIDLAHHGFDLVKGKNSQPLLLQVELDHNIILVQVWEKSYGTARLYLLDTAVAKNSPADQMIAGFLYPKDFKTKLMQEVVFGVGAVKLLRSLSLRPSIYHLNEGHTAFAVLALAVEYLHDHPEVTDFADALAKIKPEIVATKHTILPGAGLFFSRTDFEGILDQYLRRHNVSFEDFCDIGSWEREPQIFSMTKFLLNTVSRANAVSQLHAKFEKLIHKGSQLFPITNAVNLKRWQAPEFHGTDPKALSDHELWRIHTAYRKALVHLVSEETGNQLDPAALTVVWARRFAAYKRPTLLFRNPKRLMKLMTNRNRPVQFIISGQPNISDEEGIASLKEILKYTQSPDFAGKVVWLPNYSLGLAKKLVLGADIWFNTPERGKEASGTSGMKSMSNGGLQISSRDGWVDEVDWQELGWILPEPEPGTQSKIYDILEREVVPLFYGRDSEGLPREWIRMMRSSMLLTQKEYSTKRMLEEYYNKLYFP
ncbi:MAG: alpha-glucan family phosphorylase [bacterium]|nr:alpha-glucan family phosphorylase [bacterium]